MMADNIKVVIKVRPLIKREINDNLVQQWRVSDNTICSIDQSGKESSGVFTFDNVFGEESLTQDVYDRVARPIVEAAVDGINGTIFAYGQTSSGKTFTMMGDSSSPGVIPLAVRNIFDTIESKVDRDFLLRVSYIEIYNEKIRDLLDVSNIDLKIHEDFNGQIIVKCREEVTSSAEQILELMRKGDCNRSVGETQMNERSSRSHTLFQIIIESRKHVETETEEDNCVNVSQLNLVDLAGSERATQTGATKQRLREGGHINKSLSTLSLVIRQLSEAQSDGSRFISYRDSKLTRMLQMSLGGNAKTGIICAVTPATLEETHSTLMFAMRAKAIKNKPQVNAVMSDATQLKMLTKELATLQEELKSKKHLEVDNLRLQEQMSLLRAKILMGNVDLTAVKRAEALRRRTWCAPHRARPSLTPILEDNQPSDFTWSRARLQLDSQMRLSNVTEQDDTSFKLRESTSSQPGEYSSITNHFRQEGDIIVLDDSIDNGRISSSTECSPTHRCYKYHHTPPCILKSRAQYAEKELKELEEMTTLERLYAPDELELVNQIKSLRGKLAETLEQNETQVSEIQNLQESLKILGQEKDLTEKNKMKSIEDLEKFKLDNTDLQFQLDNLKSKFQKREDELLSTLREARQEHESATPFQSGSFIHQFLNMSQDISLANSEGDSSVNEIDSQIKRNAGHQDHQLKGKDNRFVNFEELFHACDTELKITKQELEAKIYKLQLLQDENSKNHNDFKEQTQLYSNMKKEHDNLLKKMEICNFKLSELTEKSESNSDYLIEIKNIRNIIESTDINNSSFKSNVSQKSDLRSSEDINNSFIQDVSDKLPRLESVVNKQNQELSLYQKKVAALNDSICEKDKEIKLLLENLKMTKEELVKATHENGSVPSSSQDVMHSDKVKNIQAAFESNLKQLQKENDNVLKEKNDLEAALKQQTIHITELKESLVNIDIKLNDVNSCNLDLSNQLITLASEKTALIKTIEELEHLKDEVKSKMNIIDDLQQKSTHIGIVEESNRELLITNSKLLEENSYHEKELINKSNTILELSDKNLVLQNENINNVNLQQKLLDYENYVTDLTSDIIVKSKTIVSLKDMKSDLMNQIQDVTSNLQAVNIVLTERDSEIASLKLSLQQHQAEHELKTTAIDNIQETLTDCEIKINKYVTITDEQTLENSHLSCKVSSLEQELAEKTNETIKIKMQQTMLSEQLENCNKELTYLKCAYEESSIESAKLEAEVLEKDLKIIDLVKKLEENMESLEIRDDIIEKNTVLEDIIENNNKDMFNLRENIEILSDNNKVLQKDLDENVAQLKLEKLSFNGKLSDYENEIEKQKRFIFQLQCEFQNKSAEADFTKLKKAFKDIENKENLGLTPPADISGPTRRVEDYHFEELLMNQCDYSPKVSESSKLSIMSPIKMKQEMKKIIGNINNHSMEITSIHESLIKEKEQQLKLKECENEKLLQTNKELQAEMDEIKVEVGLLLFETEELQKRVQAQRSDQQVENAEFSLLNSRLTAIHHYHANLHTSCASSVSYFHQQLLLLQSFLENSTDSECSEEENRATLKTPLKTSHTSLLKTNYSQINPLPEGCLNEELTLTLSMKTAENQSLLSKITSYKTENDNLQVERDSLSTQLMDCIQEIDNINVKHNALLQEYQSLSNNIKNTSSLDNNKQKYKPLQFDENHLMNNYAPKADDFKCLVPDPDGIGKQNIIHAHCSNDLNCLEELKINEFKREYAECKDYIAQLSSSYKFNVSLGDALFDVLKTFTTLLVKQQSEKLEYYKNLLSSKENSQSMLHSELEIKNHDLEQLQLKINAVSCESETQIGNITRNLEQKISECNKMEKDMVEQSQQVNNVFSLLESERKEHDISKNVINKHKLQILDLSKEINTLEDLSNKLQNDKTSQDMLSARLSELETAKTHLELEIQDLTVKGAALEATICEKEDEINLLKSEISLSTNICNDMNKQIIEKTENEINRIRYLNDQLSIEVSEKKSLELEIQQLKTIHLSQSQQISLLENKCSSLVEKKSDYESQLKQKSDEIHVMNDVFNEKINEAAESNAKQITILQQHVTHTEELLEQIGKLNNEKSSNITQISNLQGKLSNQISFEESEKHSLESEIQHLENINLSQSEKINILESKCSDLAEKLSDCEIQLNKKSADITEINKKVNEAVENNSIHTATLKQCAIQTEELSQQIKNLEDERALNISQINILEEKLSNKNIIKYSLETEIEKLKSINLSQCEKINLLESECSDLAEKLSGYESQLNKKSTDITELIKKMNQADNERASSITKTTMLEESLSSLKNENVQLRVSIESQGNQLNDSKKDLEFKISLVEDLQKQLGEKNLMGEGISKLTTRLKIIEEEKFSLLSNVNNLSLLLEEKEQQCNDISTKLKKINANGENSSLLQSENNKLKQHSMNYEKNIAELENRVLLLKEYKDKYNAITKEVNDVHRQLELKQRDCHQHESTIRILQSQVSELQTEMSVLNEGTRLRPDLHLRRQSMHDLQRHLPVQSAHLSDTSFNRDVSMEDCSLPVQNLQLETDLRIAKAELQKSEGKNVELHTKHVECEERLFKKTEESKRLSHLARSLEAKLNKLVKLSTLKQDSATNTDITGDLLSMCVDKLTHESVKDKNKQLQKVNEELRTKHKELIVEIRRLQHSLDNNSLFNMLPNDRTQEEITNLRKIQGKMELEITQLKARENELLNINKDLEIKYKDLDEECDICVSQLKEQQGDYKILYSDFKLVSAQVTDLKNELDSINRNSPSLETRKKRQSMHDSHRLSSESAPVATTSSVAAPPTAVLPPTDLPLSLEVPPTCRQCDYLLKKFNELRTHSAKLEVRLSNHQLSDSQGSGVVSNQKLCEYMEENRKLKATDAKLKQICRQRLEKIKQLEDRLTEKSSEKYH